MLIAEYPENGCDVRLNILRDGQNVCRGLFADMLKYNEIEDPLVAGKRYHMDTGMCFRLIDDQPSPETARLEFWVDDRRYRPERRIEMLSALPDKLEEMGILGVEEKISLAEAILEGNRKRAAAIVKGSPAL